MNAIEIDLEEGDERNLKLSKNVGVRFILADRVLNRRGVLGILKGIWLEKIAPCVKEVNRNKYVISFATKEFFKKAIKEGPWSVMGFYVNLKKWQLGEVIEEIDFREVEFWVQVHNLPLKMMSIGNGERIGRKIGRLIKERGRIWVALRYKKLSDFCYNCGRLGHTQKTCCEEEKKGSESGYGDHLRAEERRY
ncbi:hypothetical protein DITRI_Ditri02bG0102600 [Diplodiscus trichospermus]